MGSELPHVPGGSDVVLCSCCHNTPWLNSLLVLLSSGTWQGADSSAVYTVLPQPGAAAAAAVISPFS
jgi:hypothetical protein